MIGIALLLGLCGAVVVPQPPDEQPNLLVIVLDDVGVDRVGAYGLSTTARTPTMDLLASTGMRFDRAYSDPVCSPTRAAIMTGTYGVRTGVGTGFPWTPKPPFFALDPSAYDMLPAALGSLGYETAAIGKWHLASRDDPLNPYLHPIEMGFDRHRGPITNFTPATGDYYRYVYNAADADGAAQTMVEGYATTRQVDDALRAIDAAGDQPWFVWLSFNAPHKPWVHLPPQDLVSVDLATVDSDPERYEAILEAADTEIGRLLESLDPETLQDTIVFVLGDNGTPPGAGGKKSTVAEGGIHVPLIVWGHGIPSGGTTALVHLVDLHATLLDLAGSVRLAGPDSVSFAPLLRGHGRGARTHVYSALRKPLGAGPYSLEVRAVRNAEWKILWDAASAQGPPKLLKMNTTKEGVLHSPPYDAVQQAALAELLAALAEIEQGS